MFMSCPSQKAHPVGAKSNGKIRISATNGLDMSCSPSVLRRKNAEQRDDEIDAQKRLDIVVRLRTADRSQGLWVEEHAGIPYPVDLRRRLPGHVVLRAGLGGDVV